MSAPGCQGQFKVCGQTIDDFRADGAGRGGDSESLATWAMLFTIGTLVFG